MHRDSRVSIDLHLPYIAIQSFHQRKKISILEKKFCGIFFTIKILFSLDILLTNKQLHLGADLNIVVLYSEPFQQQRNS